MRIRVRAPGVSRISLRTFSTTEASRPASRATRACSDCSKSSSPRIAAAVTSATLSSQPAWAAKSSMTSSWIRVESTSMTTRRCARRCRPAETTAMSTPSAPASEASAVRRGSVSTPETANSTAVTGYLASRKIRSMLPPAFAIRAAMAAVDSAVSGWPRTVTRERPRPRGRLSPWPEMISACIFIDSAQLCTVARRSPSMPAGGWLTSAHRTRRPRVTTCSMSTTSTEYAARVSKSPAVMPGRSLPKILTRRVGTSGVCAAVMVSPPYPAPGAARRRGPPDGHGTMDGAPASTILPTASHRGRPDRDRRSQRRPGPPGTGRAPGAPATGSAGPEPTPRPEAVPGSGAFPRPRGCPRSGFATPGPKAAPAPRPGSPSAQEPCPGSGVAPPARGPGPEAMPRAHRTPNFLPSHRRTLPESHSPPPLIPLARIAVLPLERRTAIRARPGFWSGVRA
ncbi:exported protein of unknown function [Streptomyces murinus]